ncbi:hypothetical protein EXIGLDRAFT_726492 [Exidia glandulosa HHB12029]|uniref:GIY-YIG domain-containing protein n=1 Tax=Exidia glandulosa HHB12029 TaxID=1314781 RepID=A0A165MAU8_EXIGL|nr:hypothetical protein EXIGLDRAFT_726492 [Exidia glandulosa HHB12029]
MATTVPDLSPSKAKSRSSLVDHAFPSFYACYLLKSHKTPSATATYIGSTPHPPRRIRQHNGEIQGGAWKTKNGRPWNMNMIVYGFPSKLAALQYEWAWQHPQKTRHLRSVREEGAVFARAAKSLKKNILVARLMLSSHPYNLWPLHVKLFTSEAMRFWGEAARSTPPLPAGLTVQIELEGVDGKSGQAGSGRQGPLDVTDDVFTKAHLAKHATLHSEAGGHACAVCKEPIDIPTTDTLTLTVCPTKACTSVSHLVCLATAFTTAEASTSQRILPRGGDCPGCRQYVLWGDIVKGCYRRRIGKAVQLQEDGETSSPKKRKTATKKKASDDAHTQTVEAPKKRGRKKKAVAGDDDGTGEFFELDNIDVSGGSSESEETATRKKRSRSPVARQVEVAMQEPPRRVRAGKKKKAAVVDDGVGEFFDLDAVSLGAGSSEDEAGVVQEPTRRPRGRPRKNAVVVVTDVQLPSPSTPRRRGRPRKIPRGINSTAPLSRSGEEFFDLDDISSSSSSDDVGQDLPNPATDRDANVPVTAAKRPRGRPRKVQKVQNSMDVETQRSNLVLHEARARGRGTAPAAAPYSTSSRARDIAALFVDSSSSPPTTPIRAWTPPSPSTSSLRFPDPGDIVDNLASLSLIDKRPTVAAKRGAAAIADPHVIDLT